ncbi:MAG: hypothetical protein HY287_02690 [Planctomycetes bacterium]|nr:hypothetical protein [Planctomycetota bacterium]MBI3833218.1 hypothetical protein [Planctomycetota bacterium]
MRWRTQTDLRRLAKRQRGIIWLIAASILAQAIVFSIPATQTPSITLMLAYFQTLVSILIGVGVIRALIAQGNNIIAIALCSLLAFAPSGNILLLIMVSISVTGTLRQAGIRVGFMGAKDDEVLRALNPMLCRGCGYDLTGNVSGRCPECGRDVPPMASMIEATPL